MAASAQVRIDAARHGEYVAPLAQRELRGNQRAAALRRLDDERPSGQAADDTVPLREKSGKRLRARRIFGKDGARLRNLVQQLCVEFRIRHINAAAEHRHRTPRAQSAFMRRRVDPLRCAADHGDALRRDSHRDFLRHTLPVLGRGPSSDNRNPLRAGNRIPPREQDQRRTRNLPKNRRVLFIIPHKNANAFLCARLSNLLGQARLFPSKGEQRLRRLFIQKFLQRPCVRAPRFPRAARSVRQTFRAGYADAGRRKHRREISTVKRHRRTAFLYECLYNRKEIFPCQAWT